MKEEGKRWMREDVAPIVRKIREQFPCEEELMFCGSWRRKKLDLHDLDVLVICGDESRQGIVMWFYALLGKEPKYTKAGKVIGSIMIDEASKFKVEVYTATPSCRGAAMLHCTGNGEFNKATRGIAKAKGMLLSQYGLSVRDTRALLCSVDEKEILERLEVGWIEPEDRNDEKAKEIWRLAWSH